MHAGCNTHKGADQQQYWIVVGYEDKDNAFRLLAYLRVGQGVEGEGSGLWSGPLFNIIETLLDLRERCEGLKPIELE